jgi:O-antigen ligase
MTMLNPKKNLIQSFALNLFPVTSILITPFYSFESVNLPKFVLLVIFSGFAIIYLFGNFKQVKSTVGIYSRIFLIGFLISMVITFFSSETPWVQQMYGREGRRNGALTFLSLLIVFVIFHQINFEKFKKIYSNKIALSGIFMSIYSFLQLLGLDIFKWESVNLHFFGTLGNPNFLSAFLAITSIPVLILLNSFCYKLPKFLNYIILSVALTFIAYLIIRTRSFQGYIALGAVLLICILIWLGKHNKKRKLLPLIFVSVLVIFITLAGVLNIGPLSSILYKSSIASRGDFFRAAVNAGNANVISGLGFDSFGDYYLTYRDSKAGSRVGAEYTDSAHNYFLDIYANFGLIALIMYAFLTFIVLLKFLHLLRSNNFDKYTTSIFASWVGLQLQALVSPMNIVFLILIFSISGFIISNNDSDVSSGYDKKQMLNLGIGVAIAGLIVIPPIQREHLILVANQKASVEQLIIALEKFPKSTTGYNRTLLLFDQNNLNKESLTVARKALEFNKRTYTAYVVIITSPYTTRDEKIQAYNMLKTLDPKNPQLLPLSPFKS